MYMHVHVHVYLVAQNLSVVGSNLTQIFLEKEAGLHKLCVALSF